MIGKLLAEGNSRLRELGFSGFMETAAIVVSHHGGAVLDYAVPPLRILPRIAKVISGAIPIFVDSGIVRGTDVFKALALGANGILVGRTAMVGLATGAAEGVQKLLTGTNEEL